MPESSEQDWTCEHGVVRGEGCEEYGCAFMVASRYSHFHTDLSAFRSCAQDDHERVFRAGREAGYRDALIALAENRGQFFDELDRNIADALRSDLEYVAAHDAAVLSAASLDATEKLPPTVRAQVLREAQDEIVQLLDGFPQHGRHTRASWVVTWLDHMIERPADPVTRPGDGVPS